MLVLLVGFEAGKSELVEHLKGHTDVIRSLAISPDRKRFATASDDQTIRVCAKHSCQH